MKRRFCLSLLLSSFVLCSASHACSVPVFRYALEHWRADPYVVTLFHSGPLTAEQQELLSLLQPVNADGYPTANIFVRTVDVEGEVEESAQAIWGQHATDALPHAVVQVTGKFGAPAIDVWSGELNDENVAALIGSPVRDAVEKHLLEGTSVVWLFLESGDADKDDEVFELLSTEIERLQTVLELPDIDPADFGELSVAPEALKLQFAALRVSRDDPAEQLLVEMLLSVEPDLRDEQFVDQPMAFPVFGRGRALYALLGNGIQPVTIEDASRFLVGACQCTVKAQNPGVDLLMPVEWDRYVEPALAMDTALPPLAGLGGFVDDEIEEPADDGSSSGDEVPPIDVVEEPSVAPILPVSDGNSPTLTGTMAGEYPDMVATTDAPNVSNSEALNSDDSSFLRNTMVVIGLLIAGVVMASVLLMRRT